MSENKEVDVGIRLDIETKAKLKELANKEDRSMSYIARLAIKKHIAAERKQQ